MERRTGPAYTRRRLMRGIVVSLALLTAGCGGHSNVQFSSGGMPSGGISTGSSVYVQGNSAFAALLAIGLLAGMAYTSDLEYDSYRMQHQVNPLTPVPRSRAVPELDATRTVNEQDCTKPIVDWSANLRCK